MSTFTKVNFEIAEVIDVEPLKTGNDEQNLYSVKVEIFNTSTTQHDISARPASLNILKPPLKGEIILIFSGPNQYSGKSRKELQWYYLCTLPIQSSIYHNLLPNAASSETFTPPIESKIVNPLQSFTGDLLLQGRFGNTIRLGSSKIKQDTTTAVEPNWVDNTNDDKLITNPIIILSNTTKQKQSDQDNIYGRKYSIEHLTNDDSSFYLTTSQQLSTLKLSGVTDKSGGYNKFNKSQFIGIADRVLLVSKTNSIILDSKQRINLNAEQVLLGGDDAAEPMVNGHELLLALLDLCSALRAGTNGTGGVFSEPNPAAKGYIKKVEERLSAATNPKSILSSRYFMKK